MKKLWSIIILLAVLGGLIGAYMYINRHPQNGEKSENTKEAKIEILKLDKSSISKINLSNDKGGLSLEKKNSKWTVFSKEGLKLDEVSITTLLDGLTNLSGEKLVEKNARDLDRFGLKDSKTNISVILQDGSTKTVYIGNKTVDGSAYYIMLEGSSEVYTLTASTAECFKSGVNDIRDRSLTTIDTQDLKYVKLANINGQVIEIKANEKQTEKEKQFQINNFIITKPYSGNQSVDTTKFDEFLANIGDLRIVDFVEDSSKNISKYGLDKPRLELVVKDSKNELHLYFGKDMNDNIVFKAAGTPEIYSMEKLKLGELNKTAFDLVNKTAFMPLEETVQSITIEQSGKKDSITITKGSDQITDVYMLNDKVIQKDVFQKFYSILTDITLEGENNKTFENKPEIKIVYTLNDGSEKIKVLSLVSYNDDFYALFMEGKAEFLVSKPKVKNILKELESLK
jgi:hypothetical protein